MSSSSIRGGERFPVLPKGTDVDALGPSDSSDSGSDVQHERPMSTGPDAPDELGAVPVHRHSSSDAQGTGERASAGGDAEFVDGADIAPLGTEGLSDTADTADEEDV